jgi:hypothetical protein
MSEARDRENEAWIQRYKHGKAARIWAAIAEEQPARREVCEVLAQYMADYEEADAKAEAAFRALAARPVDKAE